MAEGRGLVLCLGEGGAASRLYLQAYALGLGLLLLEHARDVLAGAVAGFLHFYEAGVAVFLGAFDIQQERVDALLAGQLPFALVGGELLATRSRVARCCWYWSGSCTSGMLAPRMRTP